MPNIFRELNMSALGSALIEISYIQCESIVTKNMQTMQFAKTALHEDPVREKSVTASALVAMAEQLNPVAQSLSELGQTINDFVKRITNYIFEDGKGNGTLGDRAWWARQLTQWWREWETQWRDRK